MADIAKIKDRIRKLLNLAADDGAAEGEIDNALRAARQLMLAHQLSEDDVAAEPEDLRTPEQVAAETTYGTSKSWGATSRAPSWQGTLASAVAEFLTTVQVYRDHPAVHRKPSGIVANDGQHVTGWVFYGPADDCELATELHQEMLLACATLAKLKYGGSLVAGSAARDYCDGFAYGLCQKVSEAKESLEADRAAAKIVGRQETTVRIGDGGNGAETKTLSIVQAERAGAIMLAKRERGKDWLAKEKGIKLERGGGGGRRSIGNNGAYGAGMADGRSQSMSRQRVSRIGQG